MTPPAQIEQQSRSGELLTSHTDHEMWRLIRNRVDQGYSMQAVADEIGMSIAELCEWIFSYREPRPAKMYQAKNGLPLAITSSPVNPEWSRSDRARRFAIWNRAKAGAKAAREALIPAKSDNAHQNQQ